MAEGNNMLLLTTGLARVEGENAMYTRASDNFPGRGSPAISRGALAIAAWSRARAHPDRPG